MSETQTFTAIPTRVNGPTQGPVTASFFNLIRLAGKRLEEIAGAGATPETQQSVSNNAAAANVTGLSFSSASYLGFIAEVFCYSSNGTNERTHTITLRGRYNSIRARWEMGATEEGEDCTSGATSSDPSGLTFTITSGGQVQVASDNMSGSPTRKIRWTIMKTFAVLT